MTYTQFQIANVLLLVAILISEQAIAMWLFLPGAVLQIALFCWFWFRGRR